MTENVELLGQDDVIKVDEKQKGFMPHNIFTGNELTSKLRLDIAQRGFTGWKENEGIEADVLIPGKSWRKGKLVLRIEFIPDEATSESPLDEFRNK